MMSSRYTPKAVLSLVALAVVAGGLVMLFDTLNTLFT